MAKFIFVTGGVVSGLGKGVTAASLARLIKARGYKVTLQKFDPYFNMDTSNISPYQHGEVYVTEDGGEVDLVMGHYERLLGENLGIQNDVTSGQIYSSVIAKEREGYYNGSTVQVVPHITDEIKSRIYSLSENSDVVITEIGGTVGDIECHPFLEAIRQFKIEAGKGNVLYVHVTPVLYIPVSGEQKTKPTQHSVKELQNLGIQPDILVCRSDYPIGIESKGKLAQFCNVENDCIIQNLTTENIYTVPLALEDEGLGRVALRKLRLEDRTPDLDGLRAFCEKAQQVRGSERKLKIGLVGKYTDYRDAYVSLTEAIAHSGISMGEGVEISWIPSEKVTPASVAARLSGVDGVVIPAGFGERGFEGKVNAARYAREHAVPALMIGMGAQAGLVDFARSCGYEKANSTEFDRKTPYPVVYSPYERPKFRCGAYVSRLKAGTQLREIYGADEISERHRHKYEFNPAYAERLQKAGLTFSAAAQTGNGADAFELPSHPFWVGVIFRPEFKSRPDAPHPLISAFVAAVREYNLVRAKK